MSTLTEKFPTALNIDGVDCPINPDFRTVLYCNGLVEKGKELTEDELLSILNRFYKKSNFYQSEHIDKMFWFFSCGREPDIKHFPRKIAGINDKQPFDFEKDADLIYAGFMQQYGVDLQESDMHWWKFMILLENLGANTRLSKVMEYRTLDTSNKFLSKDERAFYKAMQRYYGLDTVLIVDEKAKAIEEALLNGGDISKILESEEYRKDKV